MDSGFDVLAGVQIAFVALEFSWLPPEFVGSGLQLYQIWLEERVAQNIPEYPTESPLVFDGERTRGNQTRVYRGKPATGFQLHFQVGSARLSMLNFIRPAICILLPWLQ